MQLTPAMMKTLKEFSDENLKYTHAVVHTDPEGKVAWKFDPCLNYMVAQDLTADYVLEDIDCLIVNLVKLWNP